MKDEEKLFKEWMATHNDALNPPSLRDAFAAGMEASQPKWHDLGKDPNDLPHIKTGYWSDVVYVVCICFGRIQHRECFYDYDEKCWIENTEAGYSSLDNVIAWMELPEWKGGEE